MSETSFNVTTRCPKTGNVCSLLLCSSGTAINCQLYPGTNNPDMFEEKTSDERRIVREEPATPKIEGTAERIPQNE